MAHRTSAKKPKTADHDSVDQDLLGHISALGLSTLAQYQDWCSRHGFSRRTDKHWRQRMREKAHAARAQADARLVQGRAEKRQPAKIIQGLFSGDIQAFTTTQPHFTALARALKELEASKEASRAAQRLLLHVCRVSELISAEPVVAEYGRQVGNTFVEALVALALQRQFWVQGPEDWKPRSHNTRRQFSSLVRHLFARWPVPVFMDSVWFRGFSTTAQQRQHWFVHVARGNSIRTADLPLPYTKRMAHHFMLAPDHLSVEAALRWGQILALGGSERLARAVLATRLADQFAAEDFWHTVLVWLISHPMLDPSHVGPIIDFLHHQKFVPDLRANRPGQREGDPPGRTAEPPQPNLTMKGRTPDSLLKQVTAWHQKLARTEQPAAEWRPTNIGGFEFIEGDGDNLRIWTITELLSTKALVAEGRAMKHCVASYARSCAAGACSIWTLELEDQGGRRKLLTIEVNNRTKVICQARGKCNAMPAEKHRALLRRWATQNGLTLAPSV